MTSSQSHNPYVGPRPFEREENNLFFGREREISELQSLLTAHRTLLLYAASGAGKTSLLNAGLLPLMEQERFDVFPLARVRGLIPGGVRPEDISNLYIFNTIMSWTEDEGANKTLARMSLAEFLKTKEHILDSEGFSAPRLIIFDQFEELFTLYQQHWKQKEDFFYQVAEALKEDPVLRVLFVLREDYLARLDPYVSLLPERLRARYRLVRLRFEDACQAVEGPLKGSERAFANGVAASLVRELLKTKVQSVTGETVETVGEYVEPVQLQIVCRNLWDSLPAEVTAITSGHLQSFGDVDEALTGFYENAVHKTISETNVKEEELRKWFAYELITPAETRGTVYRDKEDTAGITNAAVDILENEHIVRGEQRAGAHWYELTHDRLIEPIRNSNEIWLPDFEVEQTRLRAKKKLRRFLNVVVPMVLIFLTGLTIFSFRKAEQAERAKKQAEQALEQAEQAKKQAEQAKKQAEQAKKQAEQIRSGLQRSLTNSIGMKFLEIPAGRFTMGSSPGIGNADERPSRPVKISRPFYLQNTEVTQYQWKMVMGDNRSSFKKCGDDCPVESVSWEDAHKFIKKLNEMEGSNTYRLPTEAEWEYAVRVGTTTEFSFGDDANQLGEHAWYSKNSGKHTHSVGTKKPNAWGLYDMHGNVWEWVEDDWHGNYDGAPDDGRAWLDDAGGTDRVIRGGGWYSGAQLCRAALRNGLPPPIRSSNVGFRLARSVALHP